MFLNFYILIIACFNRGKLSQVRKVLLHAHIEIISVPTWVSGNHKSTANLGLQCSKLTLIYIQK